jgi:hypothetical protein
MVLGYIYPPFSFLLLDETCPQTYFDERNRLFYCLIDERRDLVEDAKVVAAFLKESSSLPGMSFAMLFLAMNLIFLLHGAG